MSKSDQAPHGPLTGIRIIDLSRVLAGPSATQILGDLGADIIKIEKPGLGDDTRGWGPPFLQKADGTASSESSYYLSANRNKKSIAIDFHTADGQKLLKRLIGEADILIENFKTGTLEKYGLGYDQLKNDYPRLIYCALTGFGQTGPMRAMAGYDFMIQAMGGIMSLTGPSDGMPYKTGVAIADLMTGLYAVTGILAALHHLRQTGEGQMVDIALFDTQLAWLSNAGQYYLTSGALTPRVGNAHPSIVPYEVFATKDNYMVLAIGNDHQFSLFADLVAHPEWASDKRFQTNQARVINRDLLCPMIAEILKTKTTADWVDMLEPKGVPSAPVNTIDKAFAHPQATAREMVIKMNHPDCKDPIALIGSPLKLSKTPTSYRHAPPKNGQHTDEILASLLKMDESERKILRDKKVIA
jgi:crotonobetainyl-CoA:carnitine CoA-transferase CaiB-like acyl-CoA transferase